jgi:hypothetical protein
MTALLSSKASAQMPKRGLCDSVKRIPKLDTECVAKNDNNNAIHKQQNKSTHSEIERRSEG